MHLFRSTFFVFIIVSCVAAISIAFVARLREEKPGLPANITHVPSPGTLYHGVHPMPLSSHDEDLELKDLISYETAAGKPVAWVDISQNWGISRKFPTAKTAWIKASGSFPYIRLMLWSTKKEFQQDPVFNLDAILKGSFDNDFRTWAASAKEFGSPLIVEFGPEMNGWWYPWNGYWNGAGETNAYGDSSLPDGPEHYRDAYRHIIDVMKKAGAGNILWVFHVNYNDWPNETWNRFENYYPGDDYIDWLAVSIYGAQQPIQAQWPEFSDLMEPVYRRLEKLSCNKPIVVAEFGVSTNSTGGSQALWAQHALEDLTAGRWPRVIGFAWWNAAWQNDANPQHDTNMRLQDNPALAAVFKKYVGGRQQVLGRMKK